MRTLRLLGFVLVLTCTLLAGSAVGSQDASIGAAGPVGIAVDVAVEPMDAARTQFMARISVSDVVSGELISRIHLHCIPGRPAITGTSFRESGEVKVAATVDEGGLSASYSVEYRKGAVLVALQKGAISLSPRPKDSPAP